MGQGEMSCAVEKKSGGSRFIAREQQKYIH